MKRTLFAAALSFMATAAFSFEIEKPFFSGTAGFLTTAGKDIIEDSSSIKANAESYFAGQFDFSGKLFLRGEFYTYSTSMFDDHMLEKNAMFRVEEASATYKVTGESASHYFSAFKGNFEPFGSDLFLQRQFGIAKISSDLTESYHGIEGNAIKPIYALGGSYTLHTNGNNAFAFSVYHDKAYQDFTTNKNELNFDVRYAGVFEYATMDTLCGFSFPLDGKDDGSDELLKISEVMMHAGINALFGRQKSLMLYTQFGANKVILKKAEGSDSSMGIEDFYFLIEPRIPISDFYINPSVFNFPLNTATDMIYLRPVILKYITENNILGFNLNVSNDNIYLGSSKVTAGIHGTVIMTDFEGGEFKDNPAMAVQDANKKLLVSPYANMEVFGGTVTTSITFDTEEWKSPSKAFSGTLGFKTSF